MPTSSRKRLSWRTKGAFAVAVVAAGVLWWVDDGVATSNTPEQWLATKWFLGACVAVIVSACWDDR